MLRRRKPLNRKGRIGRGNDVFSQECLEAWFTAAVLNGNCDEREGGMPIRARLITCDFAAAWIDFDPKTGRYRGTNVQVCHRNDKSTHPAQRWDRKNVAPGTPYMNEKMKYDLTYRKVAQGWMDSWIEKHT